MSSLKKIGATLALLTVIFAFASPLLAQDKRDGKAGDPPHVAAPAAVPFGGGAMGAGLGAGLVIIGASYGFGKIGSSALESMARQPETAGRVQTAMIIIGALLEGATFFALIVCIQLVGKA
jgi:F-type H+-transporting ATPase subunit c